MTDGFEIDVEVRGGERAVVVLHNLPEDILKEVRLAMFDAATLLRTNAIAGIEEGPKTGRKYARQFKKSKHGRWKKKAFKWHTASRPGEYPAYDTGALTGSLIIDTGEDSVEMGSSMAEVRKGKEKGDPQYPKWLEEGTPKGKMKPRPWLEPTLMASRGAIRRMIRESVKKAIP